MMPLAHRGIPRPGVAGPTLRGWAEAVSSARGGSQDPPRASGCQQDGGNEANVGVTWERQVPLNQADSLRMSA